MPPALIVLSHLRWDFVYQRPQQLMERIAAHSKVFFVEEPELNPDRTDMSVREAARNIFVCRPQTGCATPGFHDEQLPQIASQMQSLVKSHQLREYGVWFYTPMALPLLDAMQPQVVVYDCMDELAAFRNAPAELLEREQALFRRADVVFTGGPSLFAAKRDRHSNVHCFPSSVDVDHFARASDTAIEHAAQKCIPQPRLGFFGVIDERMDLPLLEAVAQARPEWQFVLVGPHVKIDPVMVPRRPNIHYFGQRPYDELPHFIAGWDVCLQPFALNESTRFISPTKTLEYMAGGKPIVSTPIRDVVDPYGHVVAIAHDAEEFTTACERAILESPTAAANRRAAMSATLAGTSWDATVRAMCLLVDDAVKARRSLRRLPAPERSQEIRASQAMLRSEPASQVGTIVIGAGPTGLSAGYHLGEDSLILEQNTSVGGWCRSIEEGGYTFDYAGHIMFSNDPYVHELYDKLLGGNVHWQDREAWIFSKQTYTRYPFQGALYGLPPDVLKECIVGAIEARFGPLKDPPVGRPSLHSVDTSACALKSESLIDCCGDGVESAVPLGLPARSIQRSANENFEQFIHRVWGAGVARHFAIPYNRKLWAVPLSEMETSWLGGRVPMPNLEEMIEGALQPVAKPQGPNARFGYPLRGGFQALMNGFLPLLEGGLLTGAKVAQIDPLRRKVRLSDGRTFGYRQLVSTVPLPSLLSMLGSAVPPRVAAAGSRLRHVSVRCVNLGIGREEISDKHWIYYPEESVFHRIFLQGNASPHCNPPGGFGLTCEITYSAHKPLPCDGDALIERCIRDCIDVGIIRSDDHVLVRNQVDMPYAYVVYDHARMECVQTIRSWLIDKGIHLSGRYSEWEYYNSDHAFIAGRKVAEAVRDAEHETPQIGRPLSNTRVASQSIGA